MKYGEVLAFTVLTCATPISTMNSSKSCCDDNVLMLNASQCENNKKTAIPCQIMLSLSNDRVSPFHHYAILYDTEGEYLDAYVGYTVRAPYFCEGIRRINGTNDTELQAVICLSESKFKNNRIRSTEYTLLEIYELAVAVLNIVSFALLAITALLYFVLPEVQDIDGVCTFHFTLNVGLMHAAFIHLLFFRNKLLPDLCITQVYLVAFVVLTAFAWSGVLSFNMWYRFRENRHVDESKLIKRYRYFAYGVPVCFIALANIHSHVISLYTKYQFELECYQHVSVVNNLYINLPTFVTLAANLCFFISLQMNLRNYRSIELRGKQSWLRRISYRMLLFGKLFIIMGLPWMLLNVFMFLSSFLDNFFMSFCIFYILPLFISAEGVFIFFILIVSRRRIRKAILKKYKPNCRYVPAQWRTEEDLETSQESCCSNESNQQDQNGRPATTNHDTSPNFISLHT